MRVLWKDKKDYGKISNVTAAGHRFAVLDDGSLDPQPSPLLAEKLVASRMFVYEGFEQEKPAPTGTTDLPSLLSAMSMTDVTLASATPGALIAHGPLKEAAEKGQEVYRKVVAEQVKMAREFVQENSLFAEGSQETLLSEEQQPKPSANDHEKVAESISVVADLAQQAVILDADAILAQESRKRRK